jgi:predicted metal-binding membrane protein
MGRLILFLIGAFFAVMLLLWIVAKLMAFFWIAVFIAVVFVVVRLAFSAGRRSRRDSES